MGSLLNTFLFSVWTAAYTAPRWESEVAAYAKPGRGGLMAWGFVFYGLAVGLHSLSFWKSIHKMGTIPTAVAKGAQQAGIFAFSHIVYCHIDKTECITYNYGDSLWNRMQKGVAFFCCTLGVVVYALNKRKGHAAADANKGSCASGRSGMAMAAKALLGREHDSDEYE